MADPHPMRFGVAPQNANDAIAHVTERGFPPTRIENGEDGVVYLIYAAVPDDQMSGLAHALPVHLSAKIGFMARNPEEFERLTRTAH